MTDAAAPPDQLTLGEYIASGRKAEDLTQEKLAGHIGTSVGAVRSWEQNQRIPDARGLHFLAEACPTLDPQRLLALAAAAAQARNDPPPGPR